MMGIAIPELGGMHGISDGCKHTKRSHLYVCIHDGQSKSIQGSNNQQNRRMTYPSSLLFQCIHTQVCRFVGDLECQKCTLCNSLNISQISFIPSIWLFFPELSIFFEYLIYFFYISFKI